MPMIACKRKHAGRQDQQRREHPHHQVAPRQGPGQQRLVDMDEAADDRSFLLRCAAGRLMNVGIKAGTTVIEIRATPIMAKLLVNASGWNSLPSRPLSMNTGTNDSSMISTEKKIGRPTVRQGSITSSRVSPVTLPVAEMLLQMMRGVLGHHDRLIDQDADRDRDARPAT